MDTFMLGTVEQIDDGWIVIAIPFWGVKIGDSVAVNLEDEFHPVTALNIRGEEVEKIISAHTPFKIRAANLDHSQIKRGDRLYLKRR